MAKYQVVVHETIELTYPVEADSAQEAYNTYLAERDGEGDHQCEPDESILGTEPVMIVGPDGTEIQAEDLDENDQNRGEQSDG